MIKKVSIICLLCAAHLVFSARDDAAGFYRQEKYLQLYKVVRIPNYVCSNSGGGFCTNDKECGRVGGKKTGKCAQDYGICCSVVYNCTASPETVTVNGSHIQSPPRLSSSNMCQYVLKRPEGVCQVRLDFNKFVTNDGTDSGILTGACDTDMMVVSGASNVNDFGPLCGNLTGQHMIFDYGNSDSITLDINTITKMTNWDIQVTYIKCDSPERAPPGCLQYYTMTMGTVTSFNFPNRHQKNNQDYSVCIRSVPGYNAITWSSCGIDGDFIISGDLPIIAPPDSGFMNITNAFSGTMCDADYVMIYGDNKYCGSQLLGPHMSTAQPFMLNVHFDSEESMDVQNTGFCLNYMLTRA